MNKTVIKELSSEDKKKYILSKGWKTWWNNENWVHTGIMQGANLDMCGIDLNAAYRCQKNHEKK